MGFKIGGQEFKRGAAIICNLDPIKVIASSTLVEDAHEATGLESHFRVYVFSRPNSENFIMHDKLPIPIPLHPRACQSLV